MERPEPHVPKTFFDFLEIISPVFKYYAVLLVIYYLARRFQRSLAEEAELAERQQERKPKPTLSADLAFSDSEEDVHEELTTDGSRLVSISGDTTRKRKSSKKHPLFEGLKKVEEDLRKQEIEEPGKTNVSWNELHTSMLNKYKEKYPEHGPKIVGKEEDYDDSFKELLQKHNVDIEAVRKAQRMKKEGLNS